MNPIGKTMPVLSTGTMRVRPQHIKSTGSPVWWCEVEGVRWTKVAPTRSMTSRSAAFTSNNDRVGDGSPLLVPARGTPRARFLAGNASEGMPTLLFVRTIATTPNLLRQIAYRVSDCARPGRVLSLRLQHNRRHHQLVIVPTHDPHAAARLSLSLDASSVR